jgi:CheY-like chemotaxis protein
VTAATGPAPTSVATVKENGMALRVLCADDNRDQADTTAALLRAAGCETLACYDGAEALSAAEDFRPDVCVLDLNMPGLPGEQLAVWLRARREDRRPGLVAVTGGGRAEDFRRTELAGFDAHLVKPVDPGRLVETVHRLGGETG